MRYPNLYTGRTVRPLGSRCYQQLSDRVSVMVNETSSHCVWRGRVDTLRGLNGAVDPSQRLLTIFGPESPLEFRGSLASPRVSGLLPKVVVQHYHFCLEADHGWEQPPPTNPPKWSLAAGLKCRLSCARRVELSAIPLNGERCGGATTPTGGEGPPSCHTPSSLGLLWARSLVHPLLYVWSFEEEVWWRRRWPQFGAAAWGGDDHR